MKTKLLFLHALSPLHAGTGQGVGVIDLPIAREKATGIPFVPGSSIKGVLRDSCTDEQLCVKVFGPESDNADAHAGSAQFSDARLLLLPVRSISGVFAWVTSPLILQRLQRDCTTIDNAHPGVMKVPTVEELGTCFVTPNTQIATGNQVILEEIELNATKSEDLDTWAGWLGTHMFSADPPWANTLKHKICLVHDDVLSFLLQTATEISARIRMDKESKTVEQGALWYEESLPAESILSGLTMATPVRKAGTSVEEVFDTLGTLIDGKTMQIGGNATVGRGLCQLHLVE